MNYVFRVARPDLENEGWWDMSDLFSYLKLKRCNKNPVVVHIHFFKWFPETYLYFVRLYPRIRNYNNFKTHAMQLNVLEKISGYQ